MKANVSLMLRALPELTQIRYRLNPQEVVGGSWTSRRKGKTRRREIKRSTNNPQRSTIERGDEGWLKKKVASCRE
ncbi:MAG: hypothetical protein N3B10_01485 [Armatimonadetes bacterium]|nr:hypothetical protein [Armatimonadota bacterium]